MSSQPSSRSRRPRGRPAYPDVLTPAEWRVLHWMVMYFRVDDIDATVTALSAAGVTFVGQPHRIHRDDATGDEEWMAFFEDPDRNMLALMSRVHAPAAGLRES